MATAYTWIRASSATLTRERDAVSACVGSVTSLHILEAEPVMVSALATLKEAAFSASRTKRYSSIALMVRSSLATTRR